MTRAQEAEEIGIVLYPGAQQAAVHGLTDLFNIASQLAAEAQLDRRPSLRVSHWSPNQVDDVQLSCVYRSELGMAPRPGILVVPPTLVALPDPDRCATIARWLRRHHSKGVQLVSVCSGAFPLAETGLLDGRTVATHRRCARALMENYPRIAVDHDARIIDYADILTAGGLHGVGRYRSAPGGETAGQRGPRRNGSVCPQRPRN
jgi:transcriptional regulator GlxA family with amidase domain